MPTRREFIQAGLTCGALGVPVPVIAQRTRRRRRLPVLPRVNGGINVQPLRRMDSVSDFTPPLIVPELVLLQLRSVYELGFRSMRVTLSFGEFGPDFFGAIPYVRAARALGIDVLGIIDQFGHGFDLLRALADRERRPRVLRAYHDVFGRTVAPASRRVGTPGQLSWQVLNEPTDSRSLAPSDYVRRILDPTYRILKELAPDRTVVSAATVGRRAGVWRLRQMIVSGLEQVCDQVAVHVYDAGLLRELAGLVRTRPLVVTESGTRGPAGHLGWVQETFPRIVRELGPVEQIYWFDLFDFERDAFRLIDLVAAEGRFETVVESGSLHEFWRGRVADAGGNAPYASFDELIPDLGPYLPTGEDFALVEAAR